MARIKIDDLDDSNRSDAPTEEELRRITGGGAVIEQRSLTTEGTSASSTMFNPKEYTIEKVTSWTQTRS